MKNRNIVLQSKKNLGVFLVFSMVVLSFMMTGNTSATSHTLTLSSSGAQNINITAATNTVVSTDSISVATTCRYGYNLVSSTSVNDNNLYLNGDASNNTSGTFFSPSDGTTILSNATNTWGYYYNANSAVAPTASSVFSPVPALGNTATIKTPLTTPASTDISDSFDIYYGVNSAANMAKGTYKMIPDTNNSNNDGTIVYQATMADSCIKYTVHFNPTSTATGSSVSGTGTMNDQLIAEGIATQLNSNTFTAPNGYYFAGWNTAQDGSGTTYTDGQSVTDLTTTGNTITLYAIWTDCPGGNICYSPNVSNPNDVVGEMGNQSITSSDTEAVLYAPNYSRADYGFAAWNTKADGTGTNYGPQATMEFTAGTYNTSGLKLYAKWIASAGTMQSFSASDCSAMNIGDVTARKDARDNNTYAIAKLADGKCWMIENLRLENTAAHNTDGSLSQGYNSSFIGLANPESANFDYKATVNSLYSTDGSTTATISGSDQGYRFPRYNNNNTNFRQSSSSYSISNNTYSYGNYYTWAAAVADTTYYYWGDHNTTSICPTGWHLPTGGATTGEFALLDIALGGTGSTSDSSTTPTGVVMSGKYRSYPNNFLYSGGFEGSSVDNRGWDGRYWSSTVSNSSFNSILYLYSSGVYPGTNNTAKYNGLAVRCTLGS